MKAVAGMCDNAALALFIALAVRLFTEPDLYIALNASVGLVLMWIAWQLRGVLQSEE